MKTGLVAVVVLLTLAGRKPKQRESEDSYVITDHTVVNSESEEENNYTVTYGVDVLKVRYEASQTSTAKPGDLPGFGLHPHYAYSDPDLSQVPPLGKPIRACLTDKDRDVDGDLIIARQPTPDPCMARIGNTLQYEPSPNAGDFAYVTFDILSERENSSKLSHRDP